MNDDPALRQRFAALRDEESGRAPGFEQVLRRTRATPHLGLRAVAGALSLVVVVATVAVLAIPHLREPRLRAPPLSVQRRPGADVPALAQWRAPTDFLLNTPGRELLQAIPHIGESLSGDFNALPERKSISPRPTGQEPQS